MKVLHKLLKNIVEKNKLIHIKKPQYYLVKHMQKIVLNYFVLMKNIVKLKKILQ